MQRLPQPPRDPHAGRPLAGFGLKSEHAAGLFGGELAAPDRPDFVEVHAENHMVDGGPRWRLLERVRAHTSLSVHGVGLSLGGAEPPDAGHLARLARLVRAFEPHWVSEHLAWSAHGGRWFNDLLPLVYDAPTLDRVVRHVDRLQSALGRRVLIENPSTYLQSAQATLAEADFLAALVRRSGCGLLVDVNNAYVSAVNAGPAGAAEAAAGFLDALPAEAIGEIHLAGHAVDRDAAGDRLLIDDHGAPVAPPVWALYRRLIQRIGPCPTLIERDHDLPPLPVLAAEASEARRLQCAVQADRLDLSEQAA